MPTIGGDEGGDKYAEHSLCCFENDGCHSFMAQLYTSQQEDTLEQKRVEDS
jgi:hypothetical protein